jgi:tetratricopeptide (TPR) repeat protein
VRDFATAETEFRKAIELNPNYATAYHWLGQMFVETMNRPDESLGLYRKALELEPYSLAIGTDYAMALYCTRRYDEAIAELKRNIDLDPNFVRSYGYLEQVYYAKGSYEDAVAAAEKQAALQGEKPEVIAAVKKDLLDAYRTNGAKGYWTKILKLVKGRCRERAKGRTDNVRQYLCASKPARRSIRMAQQSNRCRRHKSIRIKSLPRMGQHPRRSAISGCRTAGKISSLRIRRLRCECEFNSRYGAGNNRFQCLSEKA